jgi:hypothetical protein
MKKLFIISSFALLALGISSCTCECVGPNDQDQSNKVCKTEYENANGQGSWASYDAAAKNAGWVCK